MLIDINANIGHWPFRQTTCNACEALLERMDEYGIDVSVVSNMNGIFYKNTQASNEELYQEINAFGTALYPLPSSTPYMPAGSATSIYAFLKWG